MGVDVNEAGRDQLATRVDDLARRTVVAPDPGDAVAHHRDIRLEAGTPAAVDDEAAAHHEIGTHPQVYTLTTRRLAIEEPRRSDRDFDAAAPRGLSGVGDGPSRRRRRARARALRRVGTVSRAVVE